jgi:RNA polymerase sigma-70 factor (ECF subfamily)
VQLRQRRPEISFDPGDEDDPHASVLPESHEDPFDHASGEQFGRRLSSALLALSHSERSAFVLRHFEHYRLDEIAVALGSNINACKQAIFRAVRKLRLAMSPSRSES